MSEQNVEIAGQVFAAVTRRDIDELLELTDPEVEWYSFFAALAGGGVYHGHEGMRQYLADLDEAFEVLSPDPEGWLGIDDVVIGIGSVQYRGKASGFETTSPAGWLFKFRARKVVRFRALREPAKELEALMGPE